MPWYRHLLWPFAILYGLGVFIRNRMFDLGIFKWKEFDIPIICIGNLETGGTGKSPLVQYVAQLLLRNGLNVAVLSRGYGRSTTGYIEVKLDSIADEVGDEPLQMKLRFPDSQVVVCENRVEGVQKLLASTVKPDVIIMDDGFQHRWIKPSVNVLVTPSNLPFWKNYLLPVGTLREAKSEAKRAAAIVVSNSEQNEQIDLGKKAFLCTVKEGRWIQINGEQLNTDSIDKVVLLSGIANSERFEKTASKNCEILAHLDFADHHIYTKKDLLRLKENYNSFGGAAKAVLTTEKDAARLKNSPFMYELGKTPLFYLPINIDFLGNDKQEFDKMILAYGKHA